jgi:hypothetical protein
MIEHLFDIVESAACVGDVRGHPKIVLTRAQHVVGFRRLTAMKRDSRSLLVLTVRTALTVGLALILILVLLPAVLAAQAAGLR